MKEWRQYRQLEKGEFIVVGVDTAAGGLDFTAAQFLSKTKIDVPIVYHSKKTTTEFTNQLVTVLEGIYDVTGRKPLVAYERANGGAFELDRLAGLNRNNKYEIFKMPSFGKVQPGEPVKLGWDTNSATRPKMLQDLKQAIDAKVLKIYDKLTVAELYSFVVVQTSSSWRAQAERGAHDDLVMSLAIAWQLYQLAQEPPTEANIQQMLQELPKDDLFYDGGFY